MLNRIGHCAVSGEPVWDILSMRYAPHDDIPHRLGEPHDTAMRVTVVLLSGKWTRYTLHEDNVGGIEAAFPAIHQKNCLAMRYEIDNRVTLGAGVLSPEQAAVAEAGFADYVADVPVGVLFVERWADIWADEKVT